MKRVRVAVQHRSTRTVVYVLDVDDDRWFTTDTEVIEALADARATGAILTEQVTDASASDVVLDVEQPRVH